MHRVIKSLLAGCLVVGIYTGALMILCRDSATHFKGINPANDGTFLEAVGQRIYFVSNALSGVGFGDVAPTSATCKTITTMIHFTIFGGIVGMLSKLQKIN